VAADLRLVPHPAQADAHEPPAERPGDALPQAGLAHAGRPGEAQDRTARVGLEPAHRQVLQDALLDPLHAVVVGVEHAPRVRQVQVVLGRGVSGEGQEPVQVGTDQVVRRGAHGV
jgi:hypothetical protein